MEQNDFLVAQKEREVENLRQKLAQQEQRCAALEAYIRALFSSASWKVTAPLRRLHGRIAGRPYKEGLPPLTAPVDSIKVATGGDIMTTLREFMQLKLALFLSDPTARLTFPSEETPLVSIILVLYNKAEYTYQCLETLKANVDVPCEIIIVDNNSTDRTGDLLGRLDNVVVSRNEENLGFLKACNQAATKARGRWLLFLNNDTQVMPGFLGTMVQTAADRPEVAAVGAKLVNPDGRLQEAGSIIWQDGSCVAYGRGEDPLMGEFSYVREVDYCSGACLLVDRLLFEKIGSFDERYTPAYYEEVDLCMAVREQGYKVVYQPEAVVIHYEFGSAERSEWAINLQKANKQKFCAKWADQLQQRYEARPQNILDARELNAYEKRILVVDDRIPDPALGCGYPRTYELLQSLKELDYKITYVPNLFPERLEPCTSGLLQAGIEVLYGGAGIDFEKFYAERKSHFDIVWISRPHNMAKLIDSVRQINPKQKVVYDAEAVFACRDILKARIDGNPLTQEQQQAALDAELSLVAKADAIVAVSQQELELIHQGGTGHYPSAVLGHSVSLLPTETPFDARRDLLFIGGILDSPSPNEDAVLDFVNNIFPLIRKQLDVRLWIVGSVLVDSIKQLASETVIVTGRVDDLRPYYEQCRLFVVPSRYAGGIPLKLVEAMAHGLPAVVTPLIAEQLGVEDGSVLIGGDHNSFAEKVVSLYQDEYMWNDLRDSGLKFIHREFSADVFKARLGNLLSEL